MRGEGPGIVCGREGWWTVASVLGWPGQKAQIVDRVLQVTWCERRAWA